MKTSPLQKLKLEFREISLRQLLPQLEKALMNSKGLGNTRTLAKAALEAKAILVVDKEETAEALRRHYPDIQVMGLSQYYSQPKSLALFDNGAIIALLRNAQALQAKGLQLVDWLDYKRID